MVTFALLFLFFFKVYFSCKSQSFAFAGWNCSQKNHCMLLSLFSIFTIRKYETKYIKLKVGRRDLNEWTSSKNPTLSMSESVFPTGRFFGRITQKEPSKNGSGRTNLRQNLGWIFPEMAEKRTEYLKCYVSLIFSIGSIKNLEFSQILILIQTDSDGNRNSDGKTDIWGPILSPWLWGESRLRRRVVAPARQPM